MGVWEVRKGFPGIRLQLALPETERAGMLPWAFAKLGGIRGQQKMCSLRDGARWNAARDAVMQEWDPCAPEVS